MSQWITHSGGVGETGEHLEGSALDAAVVAWMQDDVEVRGLLNEVGGVAFEVARPVRQFPAYRGQRNFPGLYYAATLDAHVGFESWLERDHAMLLDFDPAVTAFSSQPFWLAWEIGGNRRRHAPDFFARCLDGGAWVIDCRPEKRVDKRSAEAFEFTRRACERLGWGYRLAGEIDAARVGNLRWLAGYRHRRHGQASALVAAVMAAFTLPAPLTRQAAEVGDPLEVLPVVFHLLWRGELSADLSHPFSEHTIVCRAGR